MVYLIDFQTIFGDEHTARHEMRYGGICVVNYIKLSLNCDKCRMDDDFKQIKTNFDNFPEDLQAVDEQERRKKTTAIQTQQNDLIKQLVERSLTCCIAEQEEFDSDDEDDRTNGKCCKGGDSSHDIHSVRQALMMYSELDLSVNVKEDKKSKS